MSQGVEGHDIKFNDIVIDAIVGDGFTVRACPGGPLLVRGADAVRDEDGHEHVALRPVVAVCACGKSSRRPWCDSTHKSIR